VLQDYRLLYSKFCRNYNDYLKVITGIPNVNLLVNRNTRGSVQIIVSLQIVYILEVVYLEKIFAYL